ncbi:MAG: methyltransferase domain-containing protein [Desulfobacula sp.]|nr:methyltransferase domain-containing protein [Desulfobacula sp.]
MKQSKKNYNGRNFDDLAPKFQRKIYGGFKGRVRLAVLQKDLSQFLPRIFDNPNRRPLRVLDAGGGYGPYSLQLAQMGHHVTLCDISGKMLEKAAQRVSKKKLTPNVNLVHCAIQELPENKKGPYDLVLCHAVIEWVQDPQDLITHLLRQLDQKGMLSLTFYNLNGMIFKNLLRVNYNKIIKEEYAGWPGSLTPTFPRDPADVLHQLDQQNVNIICHSGIRVFHDYILNPEDKEKHLETVLDLELKFSRRMPYRDLGRYQHILGKKK